MSLNEMKRNCQKRITGRILTAFLIFAASTMGGQGQSEMDAGSNALKEGDYKAAETFYRGLLAQSPNSPETLSNLGVALQMQGKSSEAIYSFEQALKKKQIPRTYALLAEENCKTRNLDRATPMLERIKHEYSQDPMIVALVAPCYLEIDDPLGSVRAYQELVPYRAFPPDLALMQLAKSYRKAGQMFFGLLSRAPNNALYISTISEARDRGSPDARGAFEAAERSSAYFQPNLDFPSAVAEWRAHPHDTALLYLLTVLSNEQSMRQVELCADKYPNSPYLVQLKAEVLADQNHDDEAVAQYESLMQTHPELPGLLFELGMLFRKEKEWGKALDAFRRQLARNPDDEPTAARIGEALFQLGRWRELSDFLSKRIEAPNPPLWAMLDAADTSQILDKPEQAIAILATAEQSYPSDKVIHYRLSRLYRLTGNASRAEQELSLFRTLSDK